MIQEEVMGVRKNIPPIFRISCSLSKLWIITPEHINSIALKKAWVQMWRNANCGNPSPIVTIIKPSWLDVEKAMIFLISFCVRAQIAVNKVVSAPKHRQIVIARGL